MIKIIESQNYQEHEKEVEDFLNSVNVQSLSFRVTSNTCNVTFYTTMIYYFYINEDD